MSTPDLAALSTALMQVRARARGAPGTPQRAEAAGLSLSWLCKALPSKMEPGVELLGVQHPWGPDAPDALIDSRALVELLPGELVPVDWSDEKTPEAVRIMLRFHVTPGHFRCRDCGWGDATDARGTHPGSCAACAAGRHAKIVEWTAKPEPKTETET